MAHPKQYTAFAFTEKGGKLQKISVDWKDPQEGEVVVKVLACGVCGSDEFVENVAFPFINLPTVPGHEIVGEVVAVPQSEKLWKIGQRVGSGWHGGHCLTCDTCRSGIFNLCDNVAINGVSRDGGYAEYATLRSEALLPIPEDMSPSEAAPLLCAGVTTYNSLRHMDVKPGDLVVVQGIGGLGHLAIQFANKMGYRTVALSSSADKQDLAKRLGAAHYIDGSQEDIAQALQKLGGAKVIVYTSQSSSMLESMIGGLAIDGQLLILGFPEATPLYLPSLIGKRASIRGWPSGTPRDSEETIDFAKFAGVKCMVQEFPLEKVQEAYDNRAKARFRGVIVPK
ncbi:hypothetical protein QCA50_007183 [Cerrena zonata]|uniref:Enoyl reductase (ER) domain-containing protein n=1 Tax=Cerrena zonata TaxID=2478898 RepID=A0AAW0G7S9_9APHY